MRAPEPRSSAVTPVPHCPNVTVPRVDYWSFKALVRTHRSGIDLALRMIG